MHLELDKKNLLVKLFDANELLNNVKIENMLLVDKVKNLELDLFVAKEQTNRSTSSKLDYMLSVQKSPLDKIGVEDKFFMPQGFISLATHAMSTLS